MHVLGTCNSESSCSPGLMALWQLWFPMKGNHFSHLSLSCKTMTNRLSVLYVMMSCFFQCRNIFEYMNRSHIWFTNQVRWCTNHVSALIAYFLCGLSMLMLKLPRNSLLCSSSKQHKPTLFKLCSREISWKLQVYCLLVNINLGYRLLSITLGPINFPTSLKMWGFHGKRLKIWSKSCWSKTAALLRI